MFCCVLCIFFPTRWKPKWLFNVKQKKTLENSCLFGLRYVSWYKYLIVSLFFSHLGFWSGNLFLIAPFPDLCLLVPLYIGTLNLLHRFLVPLFLLILSLMDSVFALQSGGCEFDPLSSRMMYPKMPIMHILAKNRSAVD